MSSNGDSLLWPSVFNEITGYEGYGVLFRMFFHGKRFEIALTESETSTGDEQKFLTDIMDAHDSLDKPDADWNKLEDVLEPARPIIVRLCQPWVQKLAPKIAATTSNDNLTAIIEEEAFNFRLETLNGQLQLIPRDPFITMRQLPYMASAVVRKDTPRVQASEVEILAVKAMDSIFKVRVDGQIGCCKIALYSAGDVERELKTLQTLSARRNSSIIKIPDLIAVVQHNEQFCGLITTWIERPEEIENLFDLKRIEVAKARQFSRPMREKWLSQIRESVYELHKAGLTWGDVKPENVLVDHSYNAWVVDFGLGYTHGWTTEETVCTVEGDLQAVDKFPEFLELC